MKYFVIFLILIGFTGTVFASDNQIVHIEHYQPDVELLPDNTVQFGESFTIHAWLPMYDDKPEELQYFVDVLDSENNQIDSTLWFAKEDFVYEFDTTHPAYNITKNGTYFIKIEKADQLQRTGSFYKILEFEINSLSTYLSPLKQIQSGISFDEIQCKQNLVLIQKYDGSPACVTEQTKQKLVKRGWTKDGSAFLKINTGCMTIEQSKHVASFFKTPTYLPEGYSHVCSRSGMPFESYIVYYNQEFPNNWQIPELVNEGAIFIYQIDERNFVGTEKFETFGTAEQRIQETYDEVMTKNPSLHPQLIRINGMLAFTVDSCNDCGVQTANFTDGTIIQKSTSSEAKIKFIDDNGTHYLLKAGIPLSELIKVAKSLQ